MGLGLFDRWRKDNFVDLSERYKKKQPSNEETESPENENKSDFSGSIEERRRKLAKRIADMLEKIEALSNQIYHLQQRVEVLERKAQGN